MKNLMRSLAAVTAVVMMMASCGKSAEDDSSEIDITSEIITTTAAASSAAEESSEESEEESSQEEEESEAEEEEESSQEEAEEEESEEEPEESEEEKLESEPEPEDTGSGNVTVYKGLGYSFQTDDALWFNENERLAQMQEEVARQAEEMGIDAQVQDENGNSAFDAVYSYVPDATTQPYVSNFNITAAYIGTNDVDMSDMKGQYENYYNSMPDFSVASSEMTSFNGRNAIKFILTTSAGGLDLKLASYLFVSNNYMYNVNLASTVDRFDTVSADFDNVIATFTFG